MCNNLGSSVIKLAEVSTLMFFKALALAVSGPLFLSGWLALDRASLVVLRGSASLETPQQAVEDGPGVAAEFGMSGRSGTGARASAESSSSPTTSRPPCAACECSTAANGPESTEFGFAGRIVYRAAVAGDTELQRLVLLLALLYGAFASTCGWACRGCCSDGSGRSSSVAAEVRRTRGAGYRAGLTPPRVL